MGSFRSLNARRASDQGMLTPENCPGLSPGEWVRYWKVLPHGAKTKQMAALAPIRINDEGEGGIVQGDSGRLMVIRRVTGIVGWCMFDESGIEVRWDAAAGEALLDGLPEAVLDKIDEVIGEGNLPSLGAPADPEKPKGPTVGEASAES